MLGSLKSPSGVGEGVCAFPMSHPLHAGIEGSCRKRHLVKTGCFMESQHIGRMVRGDETVSGAQIRVLGLLVVGGDTLRIMCARRLKCARKLAMTADERRGFHLSQNRGSNPVVVNLHLFAAAYRSRAKQTIGYQFIARKQGFGDTAGELQNR